MIGFGGPPAHIALLRERVVERHGWVDAREFEDANAACQLLPGPASTQLSIYCARRVAGTAGAWVGGLAFILPGLLVTIAIAAVALQDDPPRWVRGLRRRSGRRRRGGGGAGRASRWAARASPAARRGCSPTC